MGVDGGTSAVRPILLLSGTNLLDNPGHLTSGSQKVVRVWNTLLSSHCFEVRRDEAGGSTEDENRGSV